MLFTKFLFLLLVSFSVNAFTLTVDFMKTAEGYCESTLEFNYHACVDRVKKCVRKGLLVKGNFTEQERADMIVSRCFIEDTRNQFVSL